MASRQEEKERRRQERVDAVKKELERGKIEEVTVDTPLDKDELTRELLMTFEKYGVHVGTGYTKHGIVLITQDPRVSIWQTGPVTAL